MNNLKKGSFTLLVALIGGFIALWTYTRYFDDPKVVTVPQEQSMRYAYLPSTFSGEYPDLTYAAASSVHAVVHITVTQKGGQYSSNNIFDWFFDLFLPFLLRKLRIDSLQEKFFLAMHKNGGRDDGAKDRNLR